MLAEWSDRGREWAGHREEIRLVLCLTAAGQVDRRRALRATAYANDLELLSEEADPATGGAPGKPPPGQRRAMAAVCASLSTTSTRGPAALKTCGLCWTAIPAQAIRGAWPVLTERGQVG